MKLVAWVSFFPVFPTLITAAMLICIIAALLRRNTSVYDRCWQPVRGYCDWTLAKLGP